MRLAGSVVKLLEEVVSDNGAANELLIVHIDPAMKGFFSYASATEDDRVGRTSYINLFKACVEDEVKPLAERQAEVVQLFQKYKNDSRRRVSDQDRRSRRRRDDRRRGPRRLQLGGVRPLPPRTRAARRRTRAPPPDGLPDSEDDDGELSYHVELLDLIGMCAKGSNKETEEFAESFFSPTDLLTVLSERPAEELWTVDGGHKHPGLANELHAAAEKIDLDDEQDLGEERPGHA